MHGIPIIIFTETLFLKALIIYKTVSWSKPLVLLLLASVKLCPAYAQTPTWYLAKKFFEVTICWWNSYEKQENVLNSKMSAVFIEKLYNFFVFWKSEQKFCSTNIHVCWCCDVNFFSIKERWKSWLMSYKFYLTFLSKLWQVKSALNSFLVACVTWWLQHFINLASVKFGVYKCKRNDTVGKH